MNEKLSIDMVKSFFSEFLDQYKKKVEVNYTKYIDKLKLFNSFPIKIDLLFDKNLYYCAVVLSKNSKPFTEFTVDNTFQDPMMVVAIANSKRFQYGEEKSFLYLLHTNARVFPTWHIQEFVKDFINFEIAKNTDPKF